VPIIDATEAQDLDAAIERLVSATSKDDRERRLREVFVEKLDFTPSSGHVDLRGEKSNIESVARIATAEGVHVVWAPLDSQKVLVSESRAASKAVNTKLGDHLLVLSSTDSRLWHLIYPTQTAGKPVLRRMVIERGLPRRTVVTQLAKVYQEAQKADIRCALESAYDVEPVTKEFFRTYRETFDRVMAMIRGVPNEEQRRLFCQTLFNRLMFLYFVQRKGWLKFSGDSNYLPALLRASKAAGNENFFRDRLKVLFFAGLNNPQSVDVSRGASPAIGEVPFLNGGLFEEGDIDHACAGADVPNETFDAILGGLFERFNFTVSENTPYDIEVAVDPEMLGKVFEELVTGRHETGSYYTPRPVVAFMCREALKGYLETKVPGLSADAIRRFVDEHDVSGLDVTQAAAVSQALDEVTVCDPACGSGAYLVGMLHELIEFKQALYSERLGRDPTKLYDMKLHVIERNLYGADIDPFAINVAMLRLWLSLIIDFDGDTPPPLPNLDFKIVRGDSLTAPNPQSAPDLFRHAVHEAAREIANLKGRYLRESGPAKAGLRRQIEEAEGRLVAALADAPAPEGAVDWRIEFAEVFAQGGFHLALANPPYVRADAQFNHLRRDEDARLQVVEQWKEYRQRLQTQGVYTTLYEKWDLFIPFLERAHQLLAPAGCMIFIVSDSYNTAKYAAKCHDFFLRQSTIRRVDFCSEIPLFDAAISNVILNVSKRAPPPEHSTVRVVRRGRSPADFDSQSETLSPVRQSTGRASIFTPLQQTRPIRADRKTVPLGVICYLSWGLRPNSEGLPDEESFTTSDMLSDRSDAIHTKPCVQGKDTVRWRVIRVRYLEWDTERAPALFARPTFPELYTTPEKLLLMKVSGRTQKAVYDNQQLLCTDSFCCGVPWHQLARVRNRSIAKSAKYRAEALAGGEVAEHYREDLEEISLGFGVKYLLAVANSSYAKQQIDSQRRHKIQLYPDDWRRLRIPVAQRQEQAEIEGRVDAILSLFEEGYPLSPRCEARLQELESQIDLAVMQLVTSRE